jgi:hypothetical protein
MKKFISFLIFFCTLHAFAQVPQGINYQAVVRGINGSIAPNQSCIFLINYIDKSDNLTDYTEVFNTVSDNLGLVNFVLGTGTPQGGTFQSIDWSKSYSIKVDVNMGNGFVLLGQQDLNSVPYALTAAHAESADLTMGELTDVNVQGIQAGQILIFDGVNWVPGDMTSSGGEFALPINVADGNLNSFAITNTSALGGNAIYGQATTNNANATGVRGQCTGQNGRGVYGVASGTNAFGVQADNTSGTAIKGTSGGASANGVFGVSTNANGIGVRGEASNGIGVLGYSSTNTAVSASTISGSALYGSSVSGYALNTSGKIKLAGGDTNPGVGKVLTSDATGNATWQQPAADPKVGFRAIGGATGIPVSTITRVEFATESYDASNNFTAYAGGSGGSSSVFTAPVDGFYHFDTHIIMDISSATNCFDEGACSGNIVVSAGNQNTNVARLHRSLYNNPILCSLTLSGSCDVHLTAGNTVTVKVAHDNDNDSTITPSTYAGETYFTGHLIFQD